MGDSDSEMSDRIREMPREIEELKGRKRQIRDPHHGIRESCIVHIGNIVDQPNRNSPRVVRRPIDVTLTAAKYLRRCVAQ